MGYTVPVLVSNTNSNKNTMKTNDGPLINNSHKNRSLSDIGSGYSVTIPPWLEGFHEQVVVLDWPVLTSQTVGDIAKSVSALPDAGGSGTTKQRGGSGAHTHSNANSRQYVESDGQIFFEGQPVAVLAIHPSFLHPMMDSMLVKILQETTASQLQLLLILPDHYFSNSMLIPKYRISWARRLVRRLWEKAGVLSNRIRLLPTPVSEKRLLWLFKEADMVLDTYPYGSIYSHALALSVGTPVVTMRSGVTLHTPIDELHAMRKGLLNTRKFESNPIYKYLMKHDIPWIPTNSPLAGFYHRLSSIFRENIVNNTRTANGNSSTIEELLVANSSTEYADIVKKLASSKEEVYRLRVQLLDAIDSKIDHQFWSEHMKTVEAQDEDHKVDEEVHHHGTPSTQGINSAKISTPLRIPKKSIETTSEMMNDVESFFMKVGKEWSHKRVIRNHKLLTIQNYQRQKELNKKRHELQKNANFEKQINDEMQQKHKLEKQNIAIAEMLKKNDKNQVLTSTTSTITTTSTKVPYDPAVKKSFLNRNIFDDDASRSSGTSSGYGHDNGGTRLNDDNSKKSRSKKNKQSEKAKTNNHGFFRSMIQAWIA